MKQILGPGAEITPTPPISGKVIEYEIQLGQVSSPNFLKIVDVAGLVDGTTPEQDAATISALTTYAQTNPSVPNFLLVVSRIDDSRFHDKKSIFTKTLDRISTFLSSQYGPNFSTNSGVILLTRLLGEFPDVQRRPQRKIDQFKATVREFTNFSQNIGILVGDNLASENGAEMQDGFYKLPNKQLYPKNVLDSFLNISNHTDPVGYSAIHSFLQMRSTLEKYPVVRTAFNQTGTTNGELLSQIMASETGLTGSEISRHLQTAFDKMTPSDQTLARSDLIRLQGHFQSVSITKLSHLPTTLLQKVNFFQNLGVQSSSTYRLLDSAFGLRMSHMVQNPVVGYGYDVVKDEMILSRSPFSRNTTWEESPLGYKIPNFVTCSFLEGEDPVVKNYSHFVPELKNYASLRLKLLEFENSENFNVSNFQGPVRTGFTVSDNEADESVAQLSVVQEIHKVRCELTTNFGLDDEFRTSIRSLKDFDSSVEERVNEWNSFFNKFGTHIVSRVYGGGYFTGIVVIDGSIRDVLPSEGSISQSFREMLTFHGLSYVGGATASYTFFGGVKPPRLENLGETNNSAEKEGLFSTWKNSLKLDPVMLSYDLKLEPISKFVKMVDSRIGQEVERVLAIFIQEGLTYRRKKGAINPGNKIVLRRPTSTTTTTTTPPPPPPTTTTPTPQISHVTPTTIRNPYHFEPITEQSTVPITTRYSPNFDTYTPKPTKRAITTNHHQNRPPSTHLINQDTVNYDPITQRPAEISPTIRTTPSCPPRPRDGVDYRDTVVGQGYHVIKDVILPTSPLDPFSTPRKPKHGLSLHRFVEFQNYSQPCTAGYFKKYKTFKSYVLDKLNSGEINPDHVVISVPTSFPRSVRPGNIIVDEEGDPVLDYFSLYWEVRTGKMSISLSDLTTFLKNNGNSYFLRDLRDLPELGSEWQIKCDEKRRWTQFFDRYGTHVITSAYTGRSEELKLFDVNLSKGMSQLPRLYNVGCVDKTTDKSPEIGRVLRSRFSMKWTKLSSLVMNPVEGFKLDWAYGFLLRGKLDC